MNRECGATDEHDEDLTSNDDELDADEPVVFVHSFKDVKAIVKASRIPLIEYLHPHECIEYGALKSLSFERSAVA